MTDREKIRAEVERLKENHERNLKKPMERGRIGYAHGCVDCCDRILSFIDSLPEETDDGLEEAAERYAENEMMDGLAERAFTDGAKWQKRKMMEGVESGEVSAVYKFDDIVTINVVNGGLNTPLYLRLSKYKGLKEGDKVKIIIVKANEQE